MEFTSRESENKWMWRNEGMGLLQMKLGRIPKGQYFICLPEYYMLSNGKVDPNSEIGIGLSRGLFTPSQVICIDRKPEVVKRNIAYGSKKLGFTDICDKRGLEWVMWDLDMKICEKIAWVSADLMCNAESAGDILAAIMDACCYLDPTHKGIVSYLYTNVMMRENIYGKSLKGEPVHFFRKSQYFRDALRNKDIYENYNDRGDFQWKHIDYFKSECDHVTSRMPMQSSLFIKTVDGITPRPVHKQMSPAQKAWVTRRKNLTATA